MNLDFSAFLTTEGLIAFATLLALEVVLGIDNVIFITILSDKLPEGQKKMARQWGIGLAVVTRILLLLSISWVIGLTEPLLWGFSGQQIILLLGGAFLIGKVPTRFLKSLKRTIIRKSVRPELRRPSPVF